MRPTDPTTTSEPLSDPSIQCATLDDGRVAVVRVIGRGTFMNSVPLAQFAEFLQKHCDQKRKFIVDLSECPTMDSTFMGTLAKVTLSQMKENCGKTIICNANEHNRRLLKTLGLTHVMDLRQKAPEELHHEDLELRPAQAQPVNRIDRIVHMIEAHEKLVDLDTENEVRFSNVLKYLRQSLEEEKEAKETKDSGGEHDGSH